MPLIAQTFISWIDINFCQGLKPETFSKEQLLTGEGVALFEHCASDCPSSACRMGHLASLLAVHTSNVIEYAQW